MALGNLIACDAACAIPFIPGTSPFVNCVACCVKTGLGPGLQTPALCGGSNLACVTTHKVSSTAQGPGVCCAALSASGQTPVVGLRIATTNKNGKCIVCEVKQSTSKRNPGALVFKRGKAHVPGSTVSCPTTQEGCCALSGG